MSCGWFGTQSSGGVGQIAYFANISPVPLRAVVGTTEHLAVGDVRRAAFGSTAHLVQQSCMRFNAIIVGLAYRAQAQRNYSYK